MKEKVRIEGMHCESCSKMIEMELEDKVNKVSINFKTKEANIDFDNKKITKKEIISIIENLGYKAK